MTDEPEIIAAAWLHDTVEDTPATFHDVEREFGARVARLVLELTDVSRPSDGNRQRIQVPAANPDARSGAPGEAPVDSGDSVSGV